LACSRVLKRSTNSSRRVFSVTMTILSYMEPPPASRLGHGQET
jgi:hypothetical protein